MKTLIVPTVMVLIAAPVSQDLPGMAPFVEVCVIYNTESLCFLKKILSISFQSLPIRYR